MAEFANPFNGLSKPLSRHDLIRALRMDLAAEEEAVFLYSAHIDATDNKLVKAALRDISREEIVHAGEIKRLIEILNPGERDLLRQGREEVEKLAHQVAKIMEA